MKSDIICERCGCSISYPRTLATCNCANSFEQLLREIYSLRRDVQGYKKGAEVEAEQADKERDTNKKLQAVLNEIGNIIGAPTMSYCPTVERRELLDRIQKISDVIVKQKRER